MNRVILHVDMDAFFASVEQHDHPEWRGKPVVVGSPPDQRGVVSAASYEAREFGIHSAMPSSEAGRRCPHAIFAPVNMKRYAQISRQIHAIFERFTPLVEPLSIDEAFLDVSGSERLHGTGPQIAQKIKEAIQNETGLTGSVGVAHNKFLAKLASDMDKPDGLTLVPSSRTEVIRFLAPLPIEKIWGVGKVTAHSLKQAGIHRVQDLQQIHSERLASLIGQHAAQHLQRLAHGEDSRDIETEHEEKSISREYTFLKDCRIPKEVESVYLDLIDDVAEKLRATEKYAGVVNLKLRWAGFQTITRQRSLDTPVCDSFSLREVGLDLLKAQNLDKPVRLVGFGVSKLTERPIEQLSLFDTSSQKAETLSHTMDEINTQFGDDAIHRGSAN